MMIMTEELYDSIMRKKYTNDELIQILNTDIDLFDAIIDIKMNKVHTSVKDMRDRIKKTINRIYGSAVQGNTVIMTEEFKNIIRDFNSVYILYLRYKLMRYPEYECIDKRYMAVQRVSYRFIVIQESIDSCMDKLKLVSYISRMSKDSMKSRLLQHSLTD